MNGHDNPELFDRDEMRDLALDPEYIRYGERMDAESRAAQDKAYEERLVRALDNLGLMFSSIF